MHIYTHEGGEREKDQRVAKTRRARTRLRSKQNPHVRNKG